MARRCHHSNNPHSSHCSFSSSSSSCFTSNCTCCCSPNSDHHQQRQLIQTLTTQLLLLQPQLSINTPNHHHHQPLKNKPNPNPYPYPVNPTTNDVDDPSLLPLLHSLLRRVAALESSFSMHNQQRPATQPQQPQKHSLKHVAAVTIQRHFRRFLARRSRTLRDLKLLASIKSSVAALRSSLADRTRKSPRALSTKVADLLSQLDSVQSSDAMIVEGKRAVRRELVRVSEFVDKVLVREREVRELGETERRRERERRVRFAESGEGDEVFDEMLHRDLMGRGRRMGPVENGDREEDEAFDEMLRRDLGEKDSSRGFYEMFGDGKESDHAGLCNGNHGLSPPLPVKMDP